MTAWDCFAILGIWVCVSFVAAGFYIWAIALVSNWNKARKRTRR